MSVTLFGLTFHLYGFIVGLAVGVGLLLIERQARKYQVQESVFWRSVWAVLLTGILGARLYHVFTDWYLYQHKWWAIFQVWNGGLSIIGAIIGGALGAIGVTALQKKTKLSLWLLADLAVFGLPISQAIGRLANFVNQELYGLPSALPWAIFISPAHRVSGYEQFDRFHPLFAYEAIGMLACAAVLWGVERAKKWQVGSGRFFWFYIAWYGLFRAGLEFLRIEKSSFFNTNLGFNQVVLFVIGLIGFISLLFLLKNSRANYHSIALGLVLGSVILFSGCMPQTSVQQPPPQQLVDRSVVKLVFHRQANTQPLEIAVEVVNSAESRTQGLSGRQSIGQDGMLFVFPKAGMHSFWMKDMKFDLDMIWINEGKVVGITTDIPHPEENSPVQLPTYSPPSPIDMMLEAPAGQAEDWQLQAGDAFEIP